MKKFYLPALILAASVNSNLAQTTAQPTPSPRQTASTVQNRSNLSDYGVQIQPDDRLIVVMAALDAAGFNQTANSEFHQQLRRDTANLDSDLRRRMREFFTRSNRDLEKATLTDQAARYVSLAYTLSPAPQLTAPARSTDLPAGVLEVLDFAPLVKEFYDKSGINEKLPQYKLTYQKFGNELRPNIAKAISNVAAYLNTRPQLAAFERVTTTNKNVTTKKNEKSSLQKVEVRETPRQFFVVPDLLATPNSVKLRVIGEDYFAIIGLEVEPENSVEFRRAYLQFLIDPLIYKNAKEISVQREGIRSLLNELTEQQRSEFQVAQAAGKTDKDAVFQTTISPDPFLAVARSLVVAAEVRERKQKQIKSLQTAIAAQQTVSKDDATVVNNRLTFPKAEAEAFAELAEAYKNGAVLAFFFDQQLSGLESSGFDVTSSFAEMIASLDANKEKSRLKESAAKRQQAIAELASRRRTAVERTNEDESTVKIRSDVLIAGLNEVDKLLRAKDYETAEIRLRDLLAAHPGEPRILFAMGRAASLSAENVFDEDLRNERLKKAATHYVNLLQIANPEVTSPSLISNTHVALARIYEFYMDENEAYKQAALKSFDAAIALGDIRGGAYQEAVAGKARLTGK